MRLIDADALIHKFNYADGDTEDERVWIATMRRMIKEQPTAYDIDNVRAEVIDEVLTIINNHHFDNDKGDFDMLIHNLCKEVKLFKEQNK